MVFFSVSILNLEEFLYLGHRGAQGSRLAKRLQGIMQGWLWLVLGVWESGGKLDRGVLLFDSFKF